MSLDAKVIAGVRWLINTAGEVVGYRNPVTDKDQALVVDGQALPSGGTDGQVLTKQSSTNGDAAWEDPTTGAAAFADLDGEPTDNTALAAALATKAELNDPVVVSTNTSLTAAAHANRRLDLSGAITITCQTDALGGYVNDYGTSLMNVGEDTVTIAAGVGATLETWDEEATITLAPGEQTYIERIGANTFRQLEPTKTQLEAGTAGDSAVTVRGSGTTTTHTGTTAGTNVVTLTMPGGCLGANGWIDVAGLTERTPGSDNYLSQIRLVQGVNKQTLAWVDGAPNGRSLKGSAYANGSASALRAIQNGGTTGGVPEEQIGIDTANDFQVVMEITLANSTDTVSVLSLVAAANKAE